jgi:Tfp pilus assembly protein PilF
MPKFKPLSQPPAQEDQHLTDTQVDRIELAMTELSKRSANHVANAFRQALEMHKNRDDKRKIIAVIYAQLYETMLSFQMAMDSKRTVDEIRAALKVRDVEKAAASVVEKLEKKGGEDAEHI